MFNSTNSDNIYDSGAMALFERYWIGQNVYGKARVLSGNPSAVPYLKSWNAKFNCNEGCKNPAQMQEILKNIDKVNYYYLSLNSNAMELILKKYEEEKKEDVKVKTANPPVKREEKKVEDKFSKSFGSRSRKSYKPLNLKKVNEQVVEEKVVEEKVCVVQNINYKDPKDPMYLNFSRLSQNPAAVEFLEEHPDLIDWTQLCSNPSAMRLIRKDLAKPDVERSITKIDLIVSNPAAIVEIVQMLKEKPYLVDLNYVFSNPSAIRLTEYIYQKYPSKINWNCVYENPAAIHLIEEHLQQGVSKRMLEQLAGYNFWTEFKLEHFADAVAYTESDDSWKAALDNLLDMSNDKVCAMRDLEKFRIIEDFERVQKLLFKEYKVSKVDNLMKKMELSPTNANKLLGGQNPILTFEEKKSMRNLLAHEREEKVARRAIPLGDRETEKLVYEYRIVKHFSFIQASLINLCQAKTIWRGNNIPTEIDWQSEGVKEILKSDNPFRAYQTLKDQRNRVAHFNKEK